MDLNDKISTKLLTRGWVVILITLVSLLSIAWAVEFKDTITGNVTLLSANPPLELFAKTSGYITHLKNENDTVYSGQPIAYVTDRDITWDVIIDLDNLLSFNQRIHQDTLTAYLENPHLDEQFKPDIITLKKALAQYDLEQELYNPKKLVAEKYRQIKTWEQQLGILTQVEILNRRTQLLDSILLKTDEQLLADSIITSRDYSTKAQESLAKASDVWLQKKDRTQAALEIQKLNEEIVDLELEYRRKLQASKDQIRKLKEWILYKVDEWERNHIITAPFEGSCDFSHLATGTKYFNAGDLVLTVLPIDSEVPIGVIQLPIFKSGSIYSGQKANIRLKGYPFKEYGVLKAKITSISSVPQDDYYEAYCELSNGFHTSYHYQIPFRQKLQGEAEIIVSRQSLFTKVINEFRSKKLNR